MAQGKKWCFTINNYVEEDIQFVKSLGIYGMCQEEIGETNGTPHLQGFCIFKSNKTWDAMHAMHDRWHFEVMRSTVDKCEEYVSKDRTRKPGTVPFTWGVRPANRQGKRTDLDDATELIAQVTGTKRDRMRALAQQMPKQFVRYHRGFEALAEELADAARVIPPEPVWRPWQAELKAILSAPAHPRHIYWYHDHHGNQGKSYFVTYYCSNPELKAISLSGQVINMAYAFDVANKIVFFDITRSQAENLVHLYSFAESLKNGYLFSGKYGSAPKVFAPQHVVFFANVPPPPAGIVWSADRVVLKTLGEPPTPLTF